jgi:hypothetical protein
LSVATDGLRILAQPALVLFKVLPAERHGAVAERILAFGALGILDDLSQRRLPHMEIRLAAQVTWGNLLRSLAG